MAEMVKTTREIRVKPVGGIPTAYVLTKKDGYLLVVGGWLVRKHWHKRGNKPHTVDLDPVQVDIARAVTYALDDGKSVLRVTTRNTLTKFRGSTCRLVKLMTPVNITGDDVRAAREAVDAALAAGGGVL